MKIKFIVLPVFPAFLLCFCSTSLMAQTDTLPAISTSVNVDIVSRYVWRGQDLGRSPNIQPGLSASWKDFTVGAWGTYNLTGLGNQETDLYVSKKVGFVTVAVWDYWTFDDAALKDYFDYNDKTTTHLLEAQISLSGGETLPLTFMAAYFFHGADPSRSLYFELQYLHRSKFTDLAFFAGYQARGAFYASGNGFVNLGCTAKKVMSVNKRWSLPLSLSLIANPALKSAWLVAAVSF